MSTTPEDIHTVATRRDGQPVPHGSDRPTLAWPDRGAGVADADRTTRQVTVGHQQLRVDVRAGSGTGTPLLMCCGIGTSFEVLQSLVDALDPGIDIIRFDAPGVGGS